jgi:hypothetical protein
MHPTVSHEETYDKNTKNGETLSVAPKILRFKGAPELHPILKPITFDFLTHLLIPAFHRGPVTPVLAALRDRAPSIAMKLGNLMERQH